MTLFAARYRLELNSNLSTMTTRHAPYQTAFAQSIPITSYRRKVSSIKSTSLSDLSSTPTKYFVPEKHAVMSSVTQMSMASASAVSATNGPSATEDSKTLVCTSLTAPTLFEQLTQSRQAVDAGADIVEIRVDLLNESEQSEWYRLLPALNSPAIVTNRASWEGGNSQMEEPERLNVLLEAVKRGVSHIDVELKAMVPFINLCKLENIPFPLVNTKLIISHHDFENPLSLPELAKLISKMRTHDSSAIAKIAMTALSAMDNITVFHTLQQYSTPSQPCVVIAMGELGQPSRIAASKYGGYLTFASVSQGNESAPGQVDLQTLINVYRFTSITPSTSLYAVLGDPVKQSMSPALHNASMQLCQLNAAYLPIRVEAEAYTKFVPAAVQLGFKGMSVTIPGKVPVIDAMDEMDDVARQIGAMNTVVVSNGDGSLKKLKGYNTDWVAAMSAIEEAVQDGTGLKNKRVVCLGAGGAGRALAFGALARGASSVIVVNRSLEKAQNLASDLAGFGNARGMSLEDFNRGIEDVEFDVLMNSTSVGMFPKEDESPVVGDRISKGAVVFDAVYNPLKTRLLKEAEERACVTVSGVEMFVRQAAEQFQLWFPDIEPPVDKMRQVVFDKLKAK